MALFVVKATYDDEAGVWSVTDSDVPGLATEADTFEHLCQRVLALAPELLELNGWHGDGTEVPIEFIAHASSRVKLVAA